MRGAQPAWRRQRALSGLCVADRLHALSTCDGHRRQRARGRAQAAWWRRRSATSGLRRRVHSQRRDGGIQPCNFVGDTAFVVRAVGHEPADGAGQLGGMSGDAEELCRVDCTAGCTSGSATQACGTDTLSTTACSCSPCALPTDDNMLADGACGFGVTSSGDEQSCTVACAAGQTASATVACTLGA